MNQEKQRKRSKKMLPAIKILVISKAIDEPEKKREVLADELITEIEKLFPKETPPAWETLIKLISKARNSNLDEYNPWHLSTLNDHPISSRTVAQIFELKTKGLKEFSIRDAEWLDRLSSIDLDIQILCRLAQLLSLNEKYCRISKEDFDTYSWEKFIVDYLVNTEEREVMMNILASVPEGLNSTVLSEQYRQRFKQSTKEAPNEGPYSKKR
jgi:hypothetical protein